MEKSAGALPQLCLVALGPARWNSSRLFEMRLHSAPPVFKRPDEQSKHRFILGLVKDRMLLDFSLLLFSSPSSCFLFYTAPKTLSNLNIVLANFDIPLQYH